MSNYEITGHVHSLRELRRQKEELEKEISALENNIKAHMTAADIDELSGPDYKVTWKLVSSKRFDSADFRRDFPDIYSDYSRETTTRRFIVA